ncbi:hypothetical protein VP01_636g8 [Puccinia sorghi]|uniref:Uncharacterized protein n=1 Tax=Puccinia sorghi TaxID=27349 RepID=A0A0L6UG10_9BASI|nr:hypothetical protein VP01_636g8 [Puccinia sorghi]
MHNQSPISLITTPVTRPGIIHPSSDSQCSISQPVNIIKNDSSKKTKESYPRLSILLKTQTTKTQVTHKRQRRDPEFDYFKNFFYEPYCRKGNGYILIHLWFFSLIISHQVPINVWGARKKSAVSDGCPQRQKDIEKGAKPPVTSLKEIKTKRDIQEGLISNHFNQAENNPLELY